MPELPELEIVCEVLQRRVVGLRITDVQVLPPGGPIVVRDATGSGFVEALTDRKISAVRRRGKFIILDLEGVQGSLHLAVNPKLSGRLHLAEVADKRLPKTLVILGMENARQLRYADQKQMGQLYLISDLEQIPGYAGLGPEALEVSENDFRLRLKPFRG